MNSRSPIAQDIHAIYQLLLKRFGPQKWWPGETPLEVIVGAVLTQNTNWGNVEKAISNLKRKGLLSVEKLNEIPLNRLAQAIKPAGYFNVKAKRLKNVVGLIVNNYGGSLDAMRKVPIEELRRQWLSVNGVGPETADSILLYALDKPVFVVDAYTKRFLARHNIVSIADDYGRVQRVLTDALDRDMRVFNEYHALIVKLGKDHCRPKPKCELCPLKNIRYDMKSRCAQCFRAFLKEEKKYWTGKTEESVLCRSCQGANSYRSAFCADIPAKRRRDG